MVAVCGLGLCPLAAQDFTGQAIVGLNSSQIDGDGLSGFHKPGLLLGFGAKYGFNKNSSIGPEFLFSQKGSRTSQDQEANGFIYTRVRLTYIDIPVLYQYKTDKGFSFMGGPSFNVFVTGTYDFGNLSDIPISNSMRPVDIGFTAGLEYELAKNLSLAGRWFYSTIPADKGSLQGLSAAQLRTAGWQNNVISFSLRYTVFGGQGRVQSVNPPSGGI